MFSRPSWLVGFAAVSLFLSGCAKDEPEKPADQVSNIPWNRPEKWEGQGMLGGFQGSH
jgi:hypothetical protein